MSLALACVVCDFDTARAAAVHNGVDSRQLTIYICGVCRRYCNDPFFCIMLTTCEHLYYVIYYDKVVCRGRGATQLKLLNAFWRFECYQECG